MSEKLRSLRDRFGCYLSPAFYFLSFFMLDLLFRLFHADPELTPAFSWIPNLFTLCWGLIFTVLSILLRGKIKKIVMSVFLSGFILFALVNATLYHVSGNFLSFSDLAFAEDGAAFISLQYLGFSLGIWLSVLFSLAVGILAVWFAPPVQSDRWPLFLASALVLLASSLGIGALHERYYDGAGGFEWTDTYTPGSDLVAYTEFTDSNRCLMLCGNYQYFFRSLFNGIQDQFRIPAMKAELDSFYQTRNPDPVENEMTGVLQGQNALVIMLESIDTWMVTPEIMPHLYELSQSGLRFDQHYTPLFLNAGTFSTEFAYHTGLYPPVSGTGAGTYIKNEYPNSIPNLFKNSGYLANSFHALDGRFYNRDVVHLQWGYENFYDHNGMELTKDKELDTTLMDAYGKFCPSDQRFYSFLITYSGHGPYTDPEHLISSPHMEKARQAAQKMGILPEKEETLLQFEVAIAHAMETDDFIGQLVEQMKADGRWEDTALILFGDHYAKYLTDVNFLHQLKGTTDFNDICRTPLMIVSQRLDPQVIRKVTSTVDLLPTLANLFGLKYNARYLIGNDAFGEEGGFVVFRDYSYIDEEGYWNPSFGQKVTPKVKERLKEVRRILVASWNTVKCDYFSNASP